MNLKLDDKYKQMMQQNRQLMEQNSKDVLEAMENTTATGG